MEQSFQQYLQECLNSAGNNEEFARFVDALNKCLCERDLTKYFVAWLKTIHGLGEIEMPKCEKATGFFGYAINPDDVMFDYNGKKILLECKVLRDSKQYEVRNAFGQLLEYLIFSKVDGHIFDEGYVVLLDERKKQTSIFDKQNRWYVKLFQGQVWEDRPIGISAMRIYNDFTTMRIEQY